MRFVFFLFILSPSNADSESFLDFQNLVLFSGSNAPQSCFEDTMEGSEFS